MRHVFVSGDHTDLKSGHAIQYSFVHDSGISSGGMVTVLVFDETQREPGPASKDAFPTKLGEFKVHKDALVAFVAAMARDAKVAQIENTNDMGAFGL